MHADAAWWTFTLFVLGDEALHILKFVRKFSAFCICFFPLNIITGWDIYVRELSLCDMNWFHFSCDNLPFWSLIIMFNFADLYTWVLILPWKSTAGRIWDLSFSQLYPFFFGEPSFEGCIKLQSRCYSLTCFMIMSVIHWSCQVNELYPIYSDIMDL